MQLSGFVAGWTDGGEVNLLSAWTSEDEAKDACQRDVRAGEDQAIDHDGSKLVIDEEYRWILEWEESGQIGGVVAPAENGQGTYFVQKLFA